MLTDFNITNLISNGKKLRQEEHENESKKNIKKIYSIDNVIAYDGKPVVSNRNERLCPREQ